MSIWWLLTIALALNMTGFLVAYVLRSDKLTDFSYGATFFILALLGLAYAPFPDDQRVLGFGLVALWSVRLAGFLLLRIIKNKKDKRFDGVRENFWKFGMFWFFQGITAWLILLPVLIMDANHYISLRGISYIGILVWMIGLTIETLADLEKFLFNQKPSNKNKWIDEGLWHYSRHPNYLGEILVWAGTYIFAISALSGGQKLIGLISPIYITFLLVFITGIPRLEKSADQKWAEYAGYKEYKK